MIFFLIAASASDIPVDNPNRIEIFLVSAYFINGKPAVINDLRKLRNPLSWLVILLVVPFSKIPLFSKDLVTNILYFIVC